MRFRSRLAEETYYPIRPLDAIKKVILGAKNITQRHLSTAGSYGNPNSGAKPVSMTGASLYDLWRKADEYHKGIPSFISGRNKYVLDINSVEYIFQSVPFPPDEE